MKIVSVVGARPQFIKAATITRLLRQRHEEVLVHTGQHYDEALSDVFFAQLDLPQPDYHLGVGSATHGKQTALILSRFEAVLFRERPDRVLVYGDTNSTLAAALAAVKLHVPIAHVEAGLRNYNLRMPEEVNRVLTDHCSDLLFCPTQTAVQNLAREGITNGVYLTGDVMYDSLIYHFRSAGGGAETLQEWGLQPHEYALLTVHRPANTENIARVQAIFDALDRLPLPVIFPAHPRAQKAIAAAQLPVPPSVRLIEPLGYRDMLLLQRYARVILTDSGGVQKEAFFLGVPCVTLRHDTEWPETLQNDWNVLTSADTERIVAAANRPAPAGERPQLFGDGHAAEKIVRLLGI